MKTKINILSPGRFHVLDLARELDKNGFDVKFYSFVPTKRAMRFGLPKHCSASIFVLMLPFLALCRIFNRNQAIAYQCPRLHNRLDHAQIRCGNCYEW